MRLDVVAVIAVGALAVILWCQRKMAGSCEARLPPELEPIRLVYAEQLFRSEGGVLIAAKVDRAYRNAAGMLVLVELKTRAANRVYRSDVIELSAQRVALMTQTGAVVSDHAFVLTERPDGCRTGCHRVRLMELTDLIALAVRRQKLLAGMAEPRPARSPGMCRKCAFVWLCGPLQS